MLKEPKAKVIAYYLPQFHPIPENDKWWGKGFTDWISVGKAKPLFKGHYQPKVPADLGYYDLRVPETREEQAAMARRAGVYGFCYWHYWFGNGKQLLERPFNEVLDSDKPNFPFCLGWANESWEDKSWNTKGSKVNRTLITQEYPGTGDNEIHFFSLLKAFQDDRYIRVSNKPLFLIYRPEKFDEMCQFINQWNMLAKQHNLEDGFFFVAHTTNFNNYFNLVNQGFDAVTVNPVSRVINNYNDAKSLLRRRLERLVGYLGERKKLTVIDYKYARPLFVNKNEDSLVNVIPTVIPNWDHSPRSGKNGFILHNSSPEYFRQNVEDAFGCLKEKPEEMKIVFLKSWNEWGEGNYMEPDQVFKHGYLDVLRHVSTKSDSI